MRKNWEAPPPTASPIRKDEIGLELDAERVQYIDKLKAQIRSGVYQPDIRDLARSLATMMVRNL